jgi:hypothetical protein
MGELKQLGEKFRGDKTKPACFFSPVPAVTVCVCVYGLARNCRRLDVQSADVPKLPAWVPIPFWAYVMMESREAM